MMYDKRAETRGWAGNMKTKAKHSKVSHIVGLCLWAAAIILALAMLW